VKTLAEKHGYIVVSPLGYAPLGGYGQHYDIGFKPPRDGATGDKQERASQLSEEDVMKVVALVADEYGVDQSRIYQMGHSMGGHVGTRAEMSLGPAGKSARATGHRLAPGLVR